MMQRSRWIRPKRDVYLSCLSKWCSNLQGYESAVAPPEIVTFTKMVCWN